MWNLPNRVALARRIIRGAREYKDEELGRLAGVFALHRNNDDNDDDADDVGDSDDNTAREAAA